MRSDAHGVTAVVLRSHGVAENRFLHKRARWCLVFSITIGNFAYVPSIRSADLWTSSTPSRLLRCLPLSWLWRLPAPRLGFVNAYSLPFRVRRCPDRPHVLDVVPPKSSVGYCERLSRSPARCEPAILQHRARGLLVVSRPKIMTASGRLPLTRSRASPTVIKIPTRTVQT